MSNIVDLEKELAQIETEAASSRARVIAITQELDEQQKGIVSLSKKVETSLGTAVDKDAFVDFFKRPYTIIPFGKHKVLVAVPKFIKGFQIGWLWKETESYFIYEFDQYSAWLSDAPADVLDAINFEKEIDVKVEGNALQFPAAHRDQVKKLLGKHLREIGDTGAIVLRGHEFDVIAESIERGCLPFRARPVDAKDLREPQATIKLRPYQKAAYDKFLQTGAVGAFHPTGAGKSFISLAVMDVLRGKKLIIVPTRTLIEQWEHYIATYVPHIKHEVQINTYAGWRDRGDEYVLTVYDECHRLPADTFSRLAVIKTKYRLGLSASPHREDGRESYVFALTGFPIGLNWREYMETVGKSYHPVYVHTVKSSAGKMRKLEELIDPKKKTIIFCDTIQIGKEIARRFGIPYIYGDTNNRLAEIAEHKVVCISRVGDLGVSIKDLQRIIEVDFLFGSRQQELQRSGRLLHSEKAERHDIIMTEGEINQYGKRLWALQEKGFTIKIY